MKKLLTLTAILFMLTSLKGYSQYFFFEIDANSDFEGHPRYKNSDVDYKPDYVYIYTNVINCNDCEGPYASNEHDYDVLEQLEDALQIKYTEAPPFVNEGQHMKGPFDSRADAEKEKRRLKAFYTGSSYDYKPT